MARLNLGVLGFSALLTIGGAIAISYQPPIELKSSPYTSIQQAVQPPPNPFLKGLGTMAIAGGVVSGLFAYHPTKAKTNKNNQEEEDQWQTMQPDAEDDAPTDIIDPLSSILTDPPPFTGGSLKPPTSPVLEKDLWNEPEDLEPLPKAQGIGIHEDSNPFAEVEKIFHYGSAIVAGSRGSGKSTALKYLLNSRLKARPDTRLLIIDPHYDPDEDSWLFGRSPEEHDGIVIRDPFKGLSAFNKVYKEGVNREESNLKKEAPLLVVIDEYQGFITRTESGKEMSGMITYIMNAFRKFHVDVMLGLHSIKKGMCELDSSATTQMHWYLLGNLVNDTNTIIPDHWNRRELHKERVALGRYAAIVCQEGYDPFATKTPDLSEKDTPAKPQKSNVIEFKKRGA